MAFIRIKKINTQPYAYLVETKNTSQGPRQKVKQYLGRVHEFETKNYLEREISGKNKKSFLNELANQELSRINLKKIQFCNKKFTVTKKNGKEAVIKINQGHFCSFTMQRLLNFKKSNNLNNDANKLAKHFLEAGLPITKELFVKFYQLL
jgi:hypothetical protein